MKDKLPIADVLARSVLGLIFFVFGLNGFLHFYEPAPPHGAIAQFMGGLAATGYMLPLIKGVEVVGGMLLLANRFVPLALALLAPDVVNIVLFHAFMDPKRAGIAVVLLGLEVFLAWSRRDLYRPMLRARSAPVGTANFESIAPSASIRSAT